MGSKSKFGRNPYWQRDRQYRREKFLALYRANPCNRLPAPVLHRLYRNCGTTKELNSKAEQWLNDNEPFTPRKWPELPASARDAEG